MNEIDFTVCTTEIGNMWIAVSVMGGITVRGGRSDTEAGAVRNLFLSLGQQSNEDYSIAIELAVRKQTMDDVFVRKNELAPQSDA